LKPLFHVDSFEHIWFFVIISIQTNIPIKTMQGLGKSSRKLLEGITVNQKGKQAFKITWASAYSVDLLISLPCCGVSCQGKS
jgi:hypothetical protein